MTLVTWIGIGFLALSVLLALVAAAGAGMGSRMERQCPDFAGTVTVGRWSVHPDCVAAFRDSGDPLAACEWPCRLALWGDTNGLPMRIPVDLRPGVQ